MFLWWIGYTKGHQTKFFGFGLSVCGKQCCPNRTFLAMFRMPCMENPDVGFRLIHHIRKGARSCMPLHSVGDDDGS